ncbi:Crp/Fnr family transcriptional regulator [Desulfoluna sp.]|uniref:Crp/Fnr family transcriptional regulator n=1 Tax=Desulfoluna sp. TaxID=2045199 RepID=UPI002618B7C8|nr:Crp/Fnr family transcriptional regulator [Desulfoluna sp.]
MKISTVSLLEELERPEYAAMKKAFRRRRYVKGESIAFPEASSNEVFVVASGRLRVYRAYEEKEFTFAVLEPGDIYSSHTGAYVVALTDGSLLVTDVATFHREMMEAPAVTQAMLRVLGGLLKNAFQIIESLVFRDSATRLAAFLLSETRDDPEGPVIRLTVTIEELALHLGMSRQTASTLLAEMGRSGVIQKLGRGVYRVEDAARLEELAG